jgi:hypothetical protein
MSRSCRIALFIEIGGFDGDVLPGEAVFFPRLDGTMLRCETERVGVFAPRPSFFEPLAPIGTRLIASTPQAIATSTTPEPMSDAARPVACWLEPHCVSTVVAAVVMGRPAPSHAVRVRLNACSPTWLTTPPMTCSMRAGSMPVRSIKAFWTSPRISPGCIVERPPLRFPMGVRTASTITTEFPERVMSTS